MLQEGSLYRYLCADELVLMGDEWSKDSIRWQPTTSYHWGRIPAFDIIVRRKVTWKVETSNDTETLVCQDIKDRQAKGIQKYGMTVSENPLELKEWVQHAYEECLDQAVYLKRILQSLEE
jgi:hypothetical protein